MNSKTRKPIRTNTIDYYSTAVAYLNEVVGNSALASLDNPEARELVSKMKAEMNGQRAAVFGQDHRGVLQGLHESHRLRKGRKTQTGISTGVGLGVHRLAEGQQAETAPAHFHGQRNRPYHQKLQTGDLPGCRGFARGDRNPHCRIACSRSGEAHLSRLHGDLYPAATHSQG